MQNLAEKIVEYTIISCNCKPVVSKNYTAFYNVIKGKMFICAMEDGSKLNNYACVDIMKQT